MLRNKFNLFFELDKNHNFETIRSLQVISKLVVFQLFYSVFGRCQG